MTKGQKRVKKLNNNNKLQYKKQVVEEQVNNYINKPMYLLCFVIFGLAGYGLLNLVQNLLR